MTQLFLALCLAAQPIPSGDPTAPIRLPVDARGTIEADALLDRLADMARVKLDHRATGLRLPVGGVSGALVRRTIAETLGDGFAFELDADELVLRILGDRDEPAALADLGRRVDQLAGQLQALSRRHDLLGMRPRPSYRPNDPSRPTVLLVHGMNSSSGSFVHMVPPLEAAGFGVVVYDYPFNRDLDLSAPEFVRDWKAFRDGAGERLAWAVVTHSMGGLLARWYVDGPDYGGDVSSLILIAPPNNGSAAARAQAVLQLIQGTDASRDRGARALAAFGDGLGEAAADMLPGSAFLRTLQSRPRAKGVKLYVIAGDRGFLDREARKRIESRLGLLARNGGLLGGLTRLASNDLSRQLDELSDGTGDGCVSVASTRLPGAAEQVVLPANHVELIRGPLFYPDPGPVVCMPYVLRWLGRKGGG